jgi:hypothetical protein
MVLGAPRNGTSMTSGILSLLGVSMGNIRNPDAMNPTGYFEDKDFLSLGDDIYHAADQASNGYRPPSAEAIKRQQELFDDRIKELTARKISECTGRAWGWKAHSCSLFPDFFLPYLPRPHFVVVLRNPANAARDGMRYIRHDAKKHMYEELTLVDVLQAFSRYERSVYDFLARQPAIPRIVLSYEDIVANPKAAARSLSAFLELPVDASTLRQIKKFVRSKRSLRWQQRKYELSGQIRNMKRKLRCALPV